MSMERKTSTRGFASMDREKQREIARKGGGILSAVFVPEGSPAVTASADCLWYWTRSDSDQDRPN